MSIKLFGNSKNARIVKNGKKKEPKKKEKRTALDRVVAVFLVIVMLEALYCTAVFSNISFIAKYRTIWIETAMSTMSHHWLATYFIPPAVVNAVTEQVDEARAAQVGVNSSWNKGEKDAQHKNNYHNADQAEEIEQLPPDQAEFYTLFSEIDRDSMEDYVKKNPSVTASGWDKIYINEAGLDDEGTDIYTVQGDQVLAIDAENGVLLIRVRGSGYRGVLALAKDSSRLGVFAADSLGSYGAHAGDIAEGHNGILSMTASGFIDNGGAGNGGNLAGYAMCNGVEYGKAHMNWGNKRIELHEDNLFYITDSQAEVSDETTDAVEFTPALIVDGEVIVDENCGWNAINPRAIIGQNANHDIMMLVIEGRLTHSLGTGVVECAGILEEYNCMQAMNLDGGTSAIMWYDGEYVTQCSNEALPEGRTLPNAFVYQRAE
ncbi:MAG: phosphodiester glycosidase family protein [Ruminococcaceae bacterium]|nr:phosphodiester glycosidase family protein [Oscillospiraceae bacterium]